MTEPGAIAAALTAGMVIGLILGLVGGGGSILAVPLLVYGVGVKNPHLAIGTAAVAVALNAAVGLAQHARANNVKWPCATVFAVSGMGGAALGAQIGQAFDGARLLGLFGGLMIIVGMSLLFPRRSPPNPDVRLNLESAGSLLIRLVPLGFLVGLLAGFFGIGGGFLIVPGLMLATAMPIGVAIGSSLAVVTALGATTAASYALSGLVDWSLVAVLLVGGVAGSMVGRRLGARLIAMKRVLDAGFAAMVIAVGLFVIIRGLS